MRPADAIAGERSNDAIHPPRSAGGSRPDGSVLFRQTDMNAVVASTLAAGLDSTPYRVLLAAHILTAIIGLGSVTLNGLYAVEARKRQGPPGRAVSEANYRVSSLAEYLIYAVPVTGVGLVWASDGAWEFGDTWVWLSLVLIVVAVLVSRLVLMPGHRRINTLLAEMEQASGDGPPPQVAEIEQLGKAQGMAGATLHLTLVVVVVLMVWKPGA